MFLKAKKKRYLTVTCHEAGLYEGYWTELPLAEEIILWSAEDYYSSASSAAVAPLSRQKLSQRKKVKI